MLPPAPQYDQATRDRVVADARRLGNINEAARLNRVSRGAAQDWVRAADGKPTRLHRPTPAAPDPQPETGRETIERTTSGRNVETLTSSSQTIQTVEQLLAACEVDLDTWEVESSSVKSYATVSMPRALRQPGVNPETGRPNEWYRENGDPITTTMFAIAVRLRRRVELIDAGVEIRAMIEAARSEMPRGPLATIKRRQTGHMLEPTIFDLHGGKLCWGRETGHGNYDLRIAVDTYWRALEELLARSSHLAFERIILPIGNDTLNSDNDEGTTTKGTPQDNDSRHFKVFQAMREMYVRAGRRLREIAPVRIVVMPGNHDRESALMLGDALSCWFHGDRWVEVDTEPRYRKYERYGRNLIEYQHGDRGKPEQWVQVMPIEAERLGLWGGSVHREIHAGHYHREAVIEINGVKVRQLPSLTPPDAYHALNGYVGNTPGAQAFHWHAEDGLISTAVYNHRFPDEQADAGDLGRAA